MGVEFAHIEECEPKPFTCGDLREDLDSWSRRLQALGGVVGALSWYEGKTGGPISVFENHGEALGWIIEDYAKAIELTIDKNRDVFFNAKESVSSLMRGCQETYDIISKNQNISDIYVLDCRLKELDKFLKEVLVPAMHLKNAFEDLKKDILKNSKQAPEVVAAVGGV